MKIKRLKLPELSILRVDREYLDYIGITPEIENEIGIMNDRRSKWTLQEGLDYIDALIANNTESAVLHTYRSSFYLQHGDGEGTIISLRNSLRFMPDHLHIQLNLLKSYVQFNMLEEVVKMIGRDPSIVNFTNGKTSFYVGDFIEFYIAASHFLAAAGDMEGLGEVMEIAEKYLSNKTDFLFFQESTERDFHTALSKWMLNSSLDIS